MDSIYEEINWRSKKSRWTGLFKEKNSYACSWPITGASKTWLERLTTIYSTNIYKAILFLIYPCILDEISINLSNDIKMQFFTNLASAFFPVSYRFLLFTHIN